MASSALVVAEHPAAVAPQAHNDAAMVALWLHGRSPHTQRAYEADARSFLEFVGKPLPEVTLPDLQAFADSLAGQAPNTRKRRLAAAKSLLTMAQRVGYVRFNVGAAITLPKTKNTLAERILPEEDLQRIIAQTPQPKERLLLRVLYATGGRVSEVCGLRWRDAQERTEGGQLTLYGKGGKTRAVLLRAALWADLLALRGDAGPDDPIFRSRKGGAYDPSAVWRIVRAAAKRAGIEAPVSPHWFRHAHATHALERGVPIHLVQSTLGHANLSVTGQYTHARPQDSSSLYLPA